MITPGTRVGWIDVSEGNVVLRAAKVERTHVRDDGLTEIYTDHGLAIADRDGESGQIVPLTSDEWVDVRQAVDQQLSIEPMGQLPQELKWTVDQREQHRRNKGYGY